MNGGGGRPAAAPCGRCGASVPLSWEHLQGESWTGSGDCPSCGDMTVSFWLCDPDSVADFLGVFADVFPDASLSVKSMSSFGLAEPLRDGARLD